MNAAVGIDLADDGASEGGVESAKSERYCR
jgi:hypothetical protein